MKIVEIYKTQNDGSQKIIAVCKLEGEKAVCNGEDQIFIKNLEEEGVPDYSKEEGAKLFPKDGVRFLETLKLVFMSGYLRASDIMEK